MRIESDLAGALDDEDSEPSAASEMEMLRPRLHDHLGSVEAEAHLAPPRPSNPANWVVVVAAAGLVVSLLAAATLLFGGAVLSALAILFG